METGCDRGSDIPPEATADQMPLDCLGPTLARNPSWASGACQPQKQAGHMTTSKPEKIAATYLQTQGRPHMLRYARNCPCKSV